MKKIRQPHTGWFLLVLFFGVFSACWGQEYTFKKTMVEHILKGASSIVVDKNYNIYVAGSGVAKLNPSGRLIRQFTFKDRETGREIYPNDIVLDSHGNICIADSYNHVYKFDSTGKFLVKLGSQGYGEGQFQNPQGITIDSQDNIYVLDKVTHAVQKFDSTGKLLLRFGSKGGGNGQFQYPQDIAVDRKGNIYVADTHNQRIHKFDAKGKFQLMIGEFGRGDGQLDYPTGISLDDAGNLYVVDTHNHRIQKFDSQGAFLMKSGSKGTGDGQFQYPDDLTLDAQGTIYVTDSYNGRIQKLDASGKFLSKFGSFGSKDGQFYNPKGIALDKKGNIYVADSDNNRIQKFDSTGRLLLKFGSLGRNDGQFYKPYGLTLDSQGNIYVTDTDNNRIQKFDSTGKFLFKFGLPGNGNGQFSSPVDIALDGQGNMYVADASNRVQKFDASGKFILKFGSYGSGNGQFRSLKNICIDTQGNIYGLDYEGGCVQKFNSNGKFLLKFGSGGIRSGELYKPQGIFVDRQGNIYVGDLGDYINRIQKFNPIGKLINELNLSYTPTYLVVDNKDASIYYTTTHGVVVYETTIRRGTITGRIFTDSNQNCVFDNGDQALPGIVVVTQPGNYYGVTDARGVYEIIVDLGTYTVSQLLENASTRIVQPVCPATNVSSTVTLKSKGDMVTNINFANKVTLPPHLSIHITSNRRRRCFLNTTMVTYTNTGYTDAQNVKVYVKMPAYVMLKSADKPYVLDKDSNFVFTIGLLKAGTSGIIQIKDSVVCQRGITGRTVCTKAWITPANSYILSGDWDKSDLALTGKCIENGRVRMVIKNIGQGNMADSTEFRILLDAQLALRRNLKLVQGDSLVLRVPANGKTVRLEVDQRLGHPRKSQANLTLEGCVASVSEVVSTGFVNLLPQDDVEPEISIDCQQIIDSFDPNDKQVSPIGTTDQHYTPTVYELKYLIRFQNTGSDTAYTVTVIDTLSEHLDIATLQQGTSSHKYSFTVSGKGRPVLTWVFSNINLPDSTRNQLGSNGFVEFSIKPKSGLAEKTRIENFADIIFDYNDPVRTNTTFNVMYDVPKEVVPSTGLDGNKVILFRPTISSFTHTTSAQGIELTITGTHYEPLAKDNLVKINGVTVTVISSTETQLVVSIPPGVTTGKISVTTPGGTAISETDFVATPLSTEPAWSRPIRVYPNPTEGVLVVDFSLSPVLIYSVEITNLLGQKVMSKIFMKGNQTEELNLSSVGTGMYLLILKTSEGTAIRKIQIR